MAAAPTAVPPHRFAVATTLSSGYPVAAIVVQDRVYDLPTTSSRVAAEENEPSFLDLRVAQVQTLLDRWESASPLLAALARVLCEEDKSYLSPVPLHDALLLSPVPSPGKMVNVGLNYRDHAAEMGLIINEDTFAPNFFLKGDRNCIIGPCQPICVSSPYVDWEAELAVIIGKTARNVAPEEAMEYVAGFTCHNDVTDRRKMMKPDGGLDFFGGKSRDSFAPLGPYLVPRDLVPEPGHLRIRCLVNGRVMQDTTTANMLWGVERCLAFASSCSTLQPGDVLALGTGSGTGWAKGLKGEHSLAALIDNLESGGGVFLRPGDTIEVEIEKIGSLKNNVVDNRECAA
jgi:2-keto-4-pentenoate hydratase/2-oxohepta-3-ene-1,7-dioic acid hydratase in catechol pathway